jgi:hypothetical protein
MKEEHNMDKQKHALSVLLKKKKGQGEARSIKGFLQVIKAILSTKEAIL